MNLATGGRWHSLPSAGDYRSFKVPPVLLETPQVKGSTALTGTLDVLRANNARVGAAVRMSVAHTTAAVGTLLTKVPTA